MDTLIRRLLVLWLLNLGCEGSIDPATNPCASRPNGWQLLYWPADGECYRIFTKGHPCPPTQELTPGRNGTAECACPPGTALSPRDATCYSIYKPAPPCGENQYFGPVKQTGKRPQGPRWGACFEAEECEEGKVFWPKERRCYKGLSRGPCPEGLLLAADGRFGECACHNRTMPNHYWEPGLSCHEHYTRGPCPPGEIFLPDATCGCNQTMKEFNPENNRCYPIGSQGPCKTGHIFRVWNGKRHGECVCQPGFVLLETDGICYEPFTRGPCEKGFILQLNYTVEEKKFLACIGLPCPVGQLYFPGGKGCHKPGSQGPCPPGQTVLHQPTTELSYLAVCGCQAPQDEESTFYGELKVGGNCSESAVVEGRHYPGEDGCGRGLVAWGAMNTCWPLYGQGPCKLGEWLVPDRGKGQREGRGWRLGKCECRPGYTAVTDGGKVACSLSLHQGKWVMNHHKVIAAMEGCNHRDDRAIPFP